MLDSRACVILLLEKCFYVVDVVVGELLDRLPVVNGAVATTDGVVSGLLDAIHDGQVATVEGDNPRKRRERISTRSKSCIWAFFFYVFLNVQRTATA